MNRQIRHGKSCEPALWWIALICVLGATLVVAGCGDDDDDDDDPSGDDDNDTAADDDTGDDGDDDDDDDDDDDTPLPEGIYVAKTGNDVNDGSPEAPKRTIFSALAEAAEVGLPVFVAEGVYDEALVVATSLYGGYRAADWQRDIDRYETVIDSGESQALGVEAGTEATVVVEGFTIRVRNETGWGVVESVRVDQGPAILRYNHIVGAAAHDFEYDVFSIGVTVDSPEAVIIEGNTIVAGTARGNNAYSFGIEIASLSDEIIVRDNVVTAGNVNSRQLGESTGMNVEGTGTKLLASRNIFIGGDTTSLVFGFSDGVDIQNGNVTMMGNFLIGGQALGYGYLGTGAGLHAHPGSPPALLIGNTFVAGPSDLSDAVYVETGATLVDNILYANVENESNALRAKSSYYADVILVGNDLYCGGGSCVLLQTSVELLDNIARINECNWVWCAQASDNINGNPNFAGADDFHLAPLSVCIDAGVNPTTWYSGEDVYLDIDGQARPNGTGWDIGADEVAPPR